MKDLSELDTVKGSEQGFEVQLSHPVTQTDLGIFITVFGRDSAEFKKLQGEHNRRRVQKAQRAGSQVSISLAELDRETIDLLAGCTKSWRSLVDPENPDSESEPVVLLKGEKLTFSKENAVRLYREMPWAKEQVDAEMMDRGNFIKR